MAQGFELNAVVEAISKLKAAPGRMQVVATHPLVIVDYAHTPDALEKSLQTLRTFQKNTGAGKLWVVFGCGGDRDPFKRPEMGLIAQKNADVIVVTSDNPRNETPEDIIQQVVAPLESDKFMAIVDRKLAIITCLEEAQPNDIVLVAGKGHENYQIIVNEKIFFSDQQVIQEYLNLL
jgi:UDP-N-acetylmuramoyl-L-alanyl-D-glutamate--2,6-diaminopimelate ligase